MTKPVRDLRSFARCVNMRRVAYPTSRVLRRPVRIVSVMHELRVISARTGVSWRYDRQTLSHRRLIAVRVGLSPLLLIGLNQRTCQPAFAVFAARCLASSSTPWLVVGDFFVITRSLHWSHCARVAFYR